MKRTNERPEAVTRPEVELYWFDRLKSRARADRASKADTDQMHNRCQKSFIITTTSNVLARSKANLTP